MVQSVWWDLIWALIGGGALMTGLVGLIMGGQLPLVRIPDSLKPLAKLVFTLTSFVGMTLLLQYGTPNLAARVVAELMAK